MVAKKLVEVAEVVVAVVAVKLRSVVELVNKRFLTVVNPFESMVKSELVAYAAVDEEIENKIGVKLLKAPACIVNIA